MSSDDEWPAWPTFGMIDDIRPGLAQARARGSRVAIATLFRSEGGSPRGIGAQMLVSQQMLAGHVSGGCIDADVANHGRAVVADGQPRRLVYGRGGPWDMPLPCGGRIELLVECVAGDDGAVGRMLEFSTRRTPCIWFTDGLARECLAVDEADAGDPEAGTVGALVFRRYDPRARLIVIGGDPTAMAIASMAVAIDVETFLVRPQGPLEPPPLAGVRYFRTDPANALTAIGVDRFTAIATCNHDQELDHVALLAALGSPAFYVGALGSQRRRAQRLAALRANGVDEAALARLKTPLGLRIGARSPHEIAVATLAEVITARKAVALPVSKLA